MNVQMTRYLNGYRRRHEIFLALYGGWMASGLSTDFARGFDALSWVVGERSHHVWIVVALWFATILHGIGIRWNGRGGWRSPLLRLFGMLIFAAVFLVFAVSGVALSASYTYTAVVLLYVSGSYAAMTDFRLAWRGLSYV